MRALEYELFPEAHGSKGKFVTKKGTPADLIIDTGMLLCSDFDKVIPSLNTLNRLFMEGSYARAGEWYPFEIEDEEYKYLVKHLTALPLPRPYRTIKNT
ncbi:hypothetical protein [Cytobacillus firmus]|uniref:hypothetical protein n=1 Tax=Cytobacillus firmus TaxID=1399 RepID=UPI0018CD168A|nr:hypothetical protein [Cytobacillus firmus]MBG9587693.1 hypothetical protein [Cytobacillus firmus]